MNKLELKYGGRQLKFSFGLGFLGELLDVTDLSIDEVVEKLNKNPFRTIPLIMYHSCVWGYKLEDKEVDFSLAKFTEWLDADGGINTDKTSKFLETFTSSLTKDVPKEEEQKTTSRPKK